MGLTKGEKIALGLAICSVLVLFIYMKYQDGLFHSVNATLAEPFNTTNNQDSATLNVYDKTGNISVIDPTTRQINFYRDDDAHQIRITLPKPITDETIELSLMDLLAKQPTITKTFNVSSSIAANNKPLQSELFSIDTTNANQPILKWIQTLSEKTPYKLSIKLIGSPNNKIYELQMTTGPHTFYYANSPEPGTATITTDTLADTHMCLGIGLVSDTGQQSYKYNNDDAASGMIPAPVDFNTNQLKYRIRKPNPDTYRIKTINNSAPMTDIDIENRQKIMAGFSDYIPYKFEAMLDFYRSPDDYPLEVVSKPDINCNENDCVIILSGLRKNTVYTLKVRLIYFKPGTQNYRSTPELSATINTTSLNDNNNERQLLNQVKQFLKSVKQQTINMVEFNKYQAVQDTRLDELEGRFRNRHPAVPTSTN
jgi:hypothetical protein